MASLHCNENSDCLQAFAKDGTPCYTIRFPKFKEGGCSACYEKTTASYSIDLS